MLVWITVLTKRIVNDETGPMYFNGIYHLFYQYNPKGAIWGNIVWAHSVSRDLVNWKALKHAIYPSKPFDINGCWSGSATVLPGNKPVILYTGVDPQNRQVQNYAIPANLSDPYLTEWIKPDDNPIVDPDSGVNASAFRDPTTAWLSNSGHWKTIIGSKRRKRGVAYLYRSRDFVKWTKAKHPLHSAPNTGMWECPDFFPVPLSGNQGLDVSVTGNWVKHVLKVSLDVTRYEYYTVGKYYHERDRYVPDNTSVDGWSGLRYDYGNFYASKTFYDPAKKRRVLWGWANESDSAVDDVSKGWAGIQVCFFLVGLDCLWMSDPSETFEWLFLQAIPRTVWLDPNRKQLLQWPVEELNGLRGKQVKLSHQKLYKEQHVEVKGITAAQVCRISMMLWFCCVFVLLEWF